MDNTTNFAIPNTSKHIRTVCTTFVYLTHQRSPSIGITAVCSTSYVEFVSTTSSTLFDPCFKKICCGFSAGNLVTLSRCPLLSREQSLLILSQTTPCKLRSLMLSVNKKRSNSPSTPRYANVHAVCLLQIMRHIIHTVLLFFLVFFFLLI